MNYYTIFKTLFIGLFIVSIAAAGYKYIHEKDFVSVYHTECEDAEDQSNSTCFTGIIEVNTSNLDCPNDDGECLQKFCEMNTSECTFSEIEYEPE
jgi:hypothetical protein